MFSRLCLCVDCVAISKQKKSCLSNGLGLHDKPPENGTELGELELDYGLEPD